MIVKHKSPYIIVNYRTEGNVTFCSAYHNLITEKYRIRLYDISDMSWDNYRQSMVVELKKFNAEFLSDSLSLVSDVVFYSKEGYTHFCLVWG